MVAKARGSDGRRKGGVIGLRAVPEVAAAATLTDKGQRIDVVPCVSALAVRDALREHRDADWLVILTDRDESDLGPGILAHFVWQQLRNPDPWDAVKQRFDATALDRALLSEGHRAELAYGLLKIAPEEGWPAAPAGVLSRDHALGSVASQQLGMPLHSMDAFAVLAWASRAGSAATIADLRRDAGDALAEAVLRWLAGRLGEGQRPMLRLLTGGQPEQALPLGVVLHILVSAKVDGAGDRRQAELALARLEHRWSGTSVSATELQAFGATCHGVVRDMLARSESWRAGYTALGTADRIFTEAGADALARDSYLLPSSLTQCYRELAQAMGGPLQNVEAAWDSVGKHPLNTPALDGTADPRLQPFEAAVRLERWLASDDDSEEDLASLVRRQSAVDSWVDAAVNTAAQGTDDAALARAIEKTVVKAQERRTAHDRQFARCLAAATDLSGSSLGNSDNGAVWLIEDIVPKVAAKLAQQHPTLLLVLDGMSTGVATQVVRSILARPDGWAEIIAQGTSQRACGLAVLPTLTEHSRTSLLSGKLVSGSQPQEQAGFAAVAKAAGLAGARLFHKKPLDSSRPGFLLSDDIAAAIADTSELPLVACVLNSIDDALDRSDPAGISWTDEAVRHLRPLLASALAAGRAVMLTADHGHVVERRAGTQRAAADISSARSRPAVGPASEDEVLVAGTRVLDHGGRAILAVDEGLRYGPLKAGYHGGGSPAEVVVPLIVIAPEATMSDSGELAGWKLAPPQEPLWWALASNERLPQSVLVGTRGKKKRDEGPDLFSELEETIPPAPGGTPSSVGQRVVTSAAYVAQRKLAGRISLDDVQVRSILDAAASAVGTRLPLASAAIALRVPPTRLSGAVAQLQKLLNVEGYAVVRVDGGMLVLDVVLLREQFGVAG
ncbi:BREX-2 system phosphatase PglZ [Arthrobacter burdickii]|uniref:BREX-2 system phosphatase PglZ n=1 Tax=Arthrobacter burdickii TaxID=3035920 RepID=A0ABT8K7I9_9MICC|nr:BREX-2 system phosphatase PglZ [Arthrobacter burdickii]MDN4612314.1 BREX-2 system phosphatase PglZ [Arthrobacter burdickii]